MNRTIIAVRPMTEEELEQQGWSETFNGAPPALVLDDGSVLFPSADAEGNYGGALFFVNAKGTQGILITQTIEEKTPHEITPS